MRIRSMTPEDVSRVAWIEEDTFSQPWSPKGFLDGLNLPHTVFLVAEEDTSDCRDENVIAGYVCMYIAADEGEITNVAVQESFRRQGIGERMIARMQSEAGKRGVRRIVLEVRRSNDAAIRLYEKMGFRSLGIRKDFYELPKEDANIMAWEIE